MSEKMTSRVLAPAISLPLFSFKLGPPVIMESLSPRSLVLGGSVIVALGSGTNYVCTPTRAYSGFSEF